jgi:hypothetical protein
VRARSPTVLAVVGALLSLPACSPSSNGDMQLFVEATWKDDPGATAEIGYWVTVDVAWQSRMQTCSPTERSVQVTVNGRDASATPYLVGDCVWDQLFAAGPFAANQGSAVHVLVLDRATVLGEATFAGMFPGYPVSLVRPADGKLASGDSLALALTAPLPDGADLASSAKYECLDAPAGVPPFYVYARATLGSDRESIVVATPALAGRAAVTIATSRQRVVAPESSAGFASCTGRPSQTVGPIFVEVGS